MRIQRWTSSVPIPPRISNERERRNNTSTSISRRPHINPPLYVRDAIPSLIASLKYVTPHSLRFIKPCVRSTPRFNYPRRFLATIMRFIIVSFVTLRDFRSVHFRTERFSARTRDAPLTARDAQKRGGKIKNERNPRGRVPHDQRERGREWAHLYIHARLSRDCTLPSLVVVRDNAKSFSDLFNRDRRCCTKSDAL